MIGSCTLTTVQEIAWFVGIGELNIHVQQEMIMDATHCRGIVAPFIHLELACSVAPHQVEIAILYTSYDHYNSFS